VITVDWDIESDDSVALGSPEGGLIDDEVKSPETAFAVDFDFLLIAEGDRNDKVDLTAVTLGKVIGTTVRGRSVPVTTVEESNVIGTITRGPFSSMGWVATDGRK
jgi:hypothetical protein